MPDENKLNFESPLRILVIEDDPVEQWLVKSMLTKPVKYASFLRIADTISSGLKFLKEYEFDAVLLDLNLPDSKGMETLEKVTKDHSDIAIVINTGSYAEEIMGLESLNKGAQDFLIKGKCNAYVLNKILHYALQRKSLELKVKDAYHKLKEAQTQLIQVEKLKVIGGLASGVAHEVRNPLAAIRYGITYLSNNSKKDDKNVELVMENIKEAIDKAESIVADLLDFSGVSHLKRAEEDIHSVIENSLLLAKHEIEKKNITINRVFDNNMNHISIDKNKIQQVLINLILNSVHSISEQGEVTIKTYTRNLANDLKNENEISGQKKIDWKDFKSGQKIIAIEVNDNGSKIDDEHIDKIFDPFYTTRGTKGGTGLGLSVSRNIMELHEGLLFIANKKSGKGVKATIIFKG